MSEKLSSPNAAPSWQRLQLADFGQPTTRASNARTTSPSDTRPANDAEGQHTQGFLRGYDDGLAAGRIEGYAAGEAAGTAAGEQAARQLLSVADRLNKVLADVDQEIAAEVLALSLEVARQVLRQTLAAKPEVMLAAVREALGQLPHHHATIYLHPSDVELVKKHAGDQLSHAGHRIHDDPQLQRGDVVVEASGAQVDASMSTRWRRVVEMLGSKTPWIDDEAS